MENKKIFLVILISLVGFYTLLSTQEAKIKKEIKDRVPSALTIRFNDEISENEV